MRRFLTQLCGLGLLLMALHLPAPIAMAQTTQPSKSLSVTLSVEKAGDAEMAIVATVKNTGTAPIKRPWFMSSMATIHFLLPDQSVVVRSHDGFMSTKEPNLGPNQQMHDRIPVSNTMGGRRMGGTFRAFFEYDGVRSNEVTFELEGPEAPELSAPVVAVIGFYEAMGTSTADFVSFLAYDETDKGQREAASALHSNSIAQVAFFASVEQHFKDKSLPARSEWAFSVNGKSMIDVVKKAELQVAADFESAVLKSKGWGDFEIRLKRFRGQWCVDASTYIRDGHVIPGLERSAQALDAITKDIEAGRLTRLADVIERTRRIR